MSTPIPGALNFRAVAPFKTGSGRMKLETLWRSGAFDKVGPDGMNRIAHAGVRTAFDLRSRSEKLRRASPLLADDRFTVLSVDHDIRAGDLALLLSDPSTTPDACRSVMEKIYSRLPLEFSTVFGECIRAIIQSPEPVVIHCTAGKDRTGVLVALILRLLGVARDDIFEDYLRTNAERDVLRENFLNRDQGTDFGPVALDLAEPVIAAEKSYLAAFFDALDVGFGGADLYASNALRLSRGDLDALRAQLTE